jgi:N-acetylmuramoyl-L-alanine amidase
MNLTQLVADSNGHRVDLHLAIHTNAMGQDLAGKVKGCEIWIHRKGGKAEKYANVFYKNLSLLTPWKDRGIKEGYNRFGEGKPLFEPYETNAPCVLIELDFHDSVEAVTWLTTHMDAIVDALVISIFEIFP